MASKTFLLLTLAFVVILLIPSQLSAAKEASSHESEVEDAKYGRDDSGSYNGGRGGNYHTNGQMYKSSGHNGINNNCRYSGCCGGVGGCGCCRTLEEAARYKQTQTHN